MKLRIKGNSKKINQKKFFLITGITAAAFTLLCSLQSIFLIDPETGFFTDRSNLTVPLFYCLFFVLVIGTCVLSYVTSGFNKSACSGTKNTIHGASCALLAAVFLYDGIKGFFTIWTQSERTFSVFRANTHADPMSFVVVKIAWISAILMLISAYSFFAGKKLAFVLKLTLLIPVIWALFSTLLYFRITASYLHSPVLMLTILGMTFFMLFLFEYARCISDVGAGESAWFYNATGIISAATLSAAGFSSLFGKTIMYCEFRPIFLASALFCVTALFMRAKNTAAVPTSALPEEIDGEKPIPGDISKDDYTED